jgi:hypothetical protein
MAILMTNIEIYCASELGIELPDLKDKKTRELFEYFREKGIL